MALVTKEMRFKYLNEMEKENPGYLYEREKQYTLVYIFTGIRLMYSLLYLLVTMFYQMILPQTAGLSWAIVNLFGTAVFYFWYTLVLNSGGFVAVLMIVARGIGLVRGGVSLIVSAPVLLMNLPGVTSIPVIFLMVMGMILQFIEAVFCIYVLFHPRAAMAVRLNRQIGSWFASQKVPKDTLKNLAAYRNEEEENDKGDEKGENGNLKKTEENAEGEKKRTD